jgi:hypothetical protein
MAILATIAATISVTNLVHNAKADYTDWYGVPAPVENVQCYRSGDSTVCF